MLRVVLALSAFLVFASAQCTVDGLTYTNGIQSVTFGAAVGDIYPALLDAGTPENLSFGYWTVVDSRWEITEVGSASGEFCDSTGQYEVEFGTDCETITFTSVTDDCSDRTDLLSETFTLAARSGSADCVSTGTVLQTKFQESIAQPALSEQDATIVFGTSGFAAVSVGTRGILFQRWTLSTTSNGETTTIVDLGSYGTGLSCSPNRVGTYLSEFGSDCGVQLCGITDSCVSRGELLHGATTNGFEANDECPRPVDNPGLGGFGLCNPNDEQWDRHPYDCTDQDIEGGCMFCLGRANGIEVRQCLDRNGAECNAIFNSAAGKAFCTLEFECPASTVSFSLMVFISSLVALLFLR